ncbi:MAG: FAD-binding oxidoreductase [Hyphomicrobiaceae bacterium]
MSSRTFNVDAIADRLTALVGPSHVRRAADLAGFDPGMDPRNLDAGLAVLPGSTAEVSAVLRLAAEAGVTIVPQGGRTGLVGGSVSGPGQLVVMLTRLNRIGEIDTASRTLTVEAGVRLEQAEAAAAAHGLSVGIDLAARGTATIGGMISTNAGGIQAFRYGVMRQRVLGLEAVLADGAVLDEMTAVTKAATGYDLKQLFIGGEGTLGIVTKAVLKLVPAEPHRATALIAVETTARAVEIMQRIERQSGIRLAAAEAMWRDYFRRTVEALGLTQFRQFVASPVTLLLEVSGQSEEEARTGLEQGLAEALDLGIATDAILAKSERERIAIWHPREDSYQADRGLTYRHWYDISVPISRLDDYVSRLFRETAVRFPGMVCLVLGHLGDGNLHLSLASDTPFDDVTAVEDVVFGGLREMGGAFSAEHGIGLDKREALARIGGQARLQTMRAVKRALDPLGRMNPGKMLME